MLAYNVAVILWGAYVRATGSGAGCGAHWPLCNGEIVPRAAGVATLIEFSHRATSGLALLAVAALLVATFRACRAGHPARAGAVMSGVLILTEAAVGAGLVLFQLVADNATHGPRDVRRRASAEHVPAARRADDDGLVADRRLPVCGAARGRAALVIGVRALLVAGASGAVAALGDTLFPAQSLAESLRADLSFTSHLLIRLRDPPPGARRRCRRDRRALCRRLGRSRPAAPARRALVGAIAFGQIALGLPQRHPARPGVAAARAPARRGRVVDWLRAARRHALTHREAAPAHAHAA